MIYTAQDLLFSASVAVFVAVSLTIAAVRWGHKCEPYARHMDYYYPAWKVMVFSFLTSLVLTPAIFLPKEADSVLLVRQMLILSSPFYCAAIMFSYFGKLLKANWWRKPFHAVSFPFMLLILTGFTFAVIPGTQMQGLLCQAIFAATGILAVLCIMWCIMAFVMIIKAIRRVAKDNYSNPEDFPHHYARRILWIPVAHISICWIITFKGQPVLLSVGMLVLTVINVAFLIGALSPHRAKDIMRWEERTVDTPPTVQPVNDRISTEYKDELVRTIRHYVEDEKAYLDSHLTLACLSHNCGANRSYVSMVMRERLGGFYAYINRCRMSHAAKFRLDNPDASIEDIAVASGFGSRQSYYNVRRQLGE